MHVLGLALAVFWTMPAILRTWRMARFYQLEEYKSGRFLRWLAANRERWFPRMNARIMLAGIIIGFALQVIDINQPALHFLLWLLIGALLSRPERLKEVKKQFVRTQRATRLLGVAFALDTLWVVGMGALVVRSSEANSPQELSSIAILGFGGFLFSPLALPLANVLLYPVEAGMRARFLRQAKARLSDAGLLTIGITGSYGKTSTKVYLNHILNANGLRSYATPKSYNTEMGISLAVNKELDLSAGYRYFIAEMGAYVPGEVARICKLTDPKISIVSAVGPMHLERFGSLENIVTAKYEIIAGLPPDGVAVFNADDPLVRGMAERGYPATRILVSQAGYAGARFQASNIHQSLSGLHFDVTDTESDESLPFQTKLIGLHNITNILLALAVARHLGLSLAQIAAAVQTLEAAEHRLRVNALPNGITIVDDAYSANPVGAESALNAFKLHEGRRIVITPGMVELGALQHEANFKLGQQLTQAAHIIVLVGIAQTQPLQDGIGQTDFDPSNLLIFDTFEAAQTWFQANVRAGDAVLFLNDLPDTYL